MKKLILLIGFCLMGYIVTGQGTGSLCYVPQSGVKDIVRIEPTTGKHIVYSQKPALIPENHFSLTDMVNEIDAYFTILDSYNINDFEIIDNYVIFCGDFFYGGGYTGILGWFDIDSLFYYGAPAHVDVSLFTLGMESIENIEVFYDLSNVLHIVGYGRTPAPTGSSSTYYRVFEATGNFPGLLNWRTSDLWRYGTKSDIVDMAVTDNYVVFLGWDRLSNNYDGVGITLHPFPKYSMFPSSTMSAYYFQLQTNNNYPTCPDYFDPISSPRITHSRKDSVSVCSYRQDIDPSHPFGNGTYYLSHWIYDVSPCLSGLPVQMVSAATILLPGNVNNIVDYAFDINSSNYVILHSHELSAGNMEYAFSTIDFSSGSVPAYMVSDYQTAYNTNSYWRPFSLCLDGMSKYTISGWEQLSHYQILWHNTINTVSGLCSRSIQYAIQPQDILRQREEPFTANLQGWSKLSFGMGWAATIDYFPCIELCSPNK